MNDLERLEGLYYGQIDDPYEKWLVDHAIEDKIAVISYDGSGGFLGLGKIRLVKGVIYPKD